MGTDGRSTPVSWTRREFVRAAAGVLTLPHLRVESGRHRTYMAYVACGSGAICVFSAAGNRESEPWSPIQRVSSSAPAFLLHTPAKAVLYVANEVAVHQGLPRGTVEAYRVHGVDGRLSLLGRTPLSLSATRPRHMALSPDGKWLAVAAYGGGIYNLLPVASDGSLGEPRGIFKDTGCGSDSELQASAHPHTLLFAGKKLVSSDFGSDRINVFAVEDGRLIRNAQHLTGAGCGPGVCVLHPAGFLYTSHDLANGIGGYRYDTASGTVGAAIDGSAARGSSGSLALHPSTGSLYATDEQRRLLRVWQVHERSGRLLHAQDVPLGRVTPSHVFVAPDGERVFILDSRSGLIVQCIADRSSGELSAAATVDTVPAPRSIAVHAI